MLLSFLAAMLAVVAPAAAPSSAPSLAEGQVWEYRHRPQDQGSLLKIQRVENLAGQDVFHVSITGVRLFGRTTEIQHMPMSRESMDNSVIRLAADSGVFPSADEGIGMWREAEGGVFTITVAEAVDLAERTAGKAPDQAGVPVD